MVIKTVSAIFTMLGAFSMMAVSLLCFKSNIKEETLMQAFAVSFILASIGVLTSR